MKRVMMAVVAVAAVPAFAALKPACLFNDNLVLQREKPVPVWGTAQAGNEVKVSFAGNCEKTVADADGKWRVELPAMAADAEGKMLVVVESEPGWFGSEIDRVEFKNVVVGEVWLCGGQSNMTFAMWPKPSVGKHAGREMNGYFDLMMTRLPDVRGVVMPRCFAAEESDHERLVWKSFVPESALGDFSGAAWHFAVRLNQVLGVPVGVIESAWGGSMIQPWIPAGALAESSVESIRKLATSKVRTEPNEWEKQKMQKEKGWKPGLHQQARACWNAMIYPLAPYAIRGAIWYQGCSNRGDDRYYEFLRCLRSGWGRAFGCGDDMPFFLCQIAPYSYDLPEASDPGKVRIREQMEKFGLDFAPSAGCVNLSDVGEIDCIHPGDKRTVGTRLAAMALNRIYGKKSIKCDGPIFKAANLSDDGKTVRLSFDNVEGWCMKGEYRPRFELAGEDGNFVQVDSVIKSNAKTIDLKVPANMVPVKVAYLRRSNVHSFVKNEVGIPIGPFMGEVKK